MENSMLIFDWGDTLMQILPGMQGAMADWPVVKEVNGAWSVLNELSNKHACYIATNAEDSNANQIQAALARVDLDKFISGIFTKTEIGCRKDDPEFYRSISKILHETSDHMIMIGDDHDQDVMSAHKAGLHTIWLNSKGVELNKGIPYHDAENPNLGEIIRVIETKFPPTIETCDKWLDEYHVPGNIRRHMQAVADNAYKLAVKLLHTNVDVDPIMVHRAGWLHDIGKLQESTVKRDHGEVGADILREKGEAELAEIIEKHIVESILREPFHEWSWNTKIVFYVDKLFDGETRMDITDRLNRLGIRYPKSKKELEKALPFILALENEIKLLL
jgi:putative nucleotidyltransferase with HDIG domain